MDKNSSAANFAILQTFLAGAGLLASRTQSIGVFEKFKYYIIAGAIIGSIGIASLLAGLYFYLITVMQPYEVCMIMGGVILALALAILGSRIFVIFMIKRKIKNAIKELYEDTKDVLANLTDELKKPIQDNPKTAVVIAAIAGFIVIRKLLDK